MLIQDALAEFLRTRQAMACSPRTIGGYRYELEGVFCRWLAEQGVTETEQLSPQVLTAYLGWYRDRGVSGNTLFSVRTRFGTFVNWCGVMGYCKADILRAVPRPRVHHFIRRTHTEEEVKRLLDTAADQRLYHPFDGQELVAMLLLLLDTGLRAGEVVGLDVGDLDGELIKVRGKGQRERLVMISDLTRKALGEYLRLRPVAGPREPLFLNHGNGSNYHKRGLRITDRALYQRIMRLGRAAGIPTSPHKWRHTFAVFAVKNGANLKALQLFLGHKSLSTTDNYLRGFGFGDAAREHKVFSPVSAMMQH